MRWCTSLTAIRPRATNAAIRARPPLRMQKIAKKRRPRTDGDEHDRRRVNITEPTVICGDHALQVLEFLQAEYQLLRHVKHQHDRNPSKPTSAGTHNCLLSDRLAEKPASAES